MARVTRSTVDLSGYPDLVVIYLGMRALNVRGLRTLVRLGKEIRRSAEARPDGLLRHETVTYSLFPLHSGMRQYWRDLDAMERWTRTGTHRQWWDRYLRDPAGTAFWHETYFRSGGMEAVYVDMPDRVGLQAFLEPVPARGGMFSARLRAGLGQAPAAVVPEDELEPV
jgi:hypothetical protein